MPSPLASAQKAPAAAPAAKAPVRPLPFLRGTVEHTEPFFDQTFTLSANQQNLGPIDIATFGFARALVFDVDIVSAGNAAAVAVVEDAPWSAFAELAVQDVNGAPIYGPHTGYETYLHHKYGGFRNQPDPKLYPTSVFSAIVTGGGATGGTGSFMLRINLDRGGRDGVGALANMNASSSYKVRGTISNLAGIYSVSPTNAPTLRLRISLEAYSQPNPTDAAGRPQATTPPANMTTGFSSRFQVTANAGANTVKHTRVGNYIRNNIYILRRAGTSRVNGQADLLTQQLQWLVDSRLLTNKLFEMIQMQLAEWFNLTSPTFEAAGGPDNGVFVLPFMTEFDGAAGYETRDLWLPTTQATRYELLIPNLANSGVLTVMTDDVSPQGNVFMS
jgi:hypothetical protein